MTRGNNPRPFTPDEMDRFREQEIELMEKQTEEKESRQAARVNSYTTKEADRVIDAVKVATINSESFFSVVGGAGSSTDVLAQAQVLTVRGREHKRAEKAKEAAAKSEAKATAKAAEAKEKAECKQAAKEAAKEAKAIEKAETAKAKAVAKANAQLANLKRKQLAEDPIEQWEENAPGLASAASATSTHKVGPAGPVVSAGPAVPVLKQPRTEMPKPSVSAQAVHVELARTAEVPKQTWADIQERLGGEVRDESLAKKKALEERHDVMWGAVPPVQRTKVQQNEKEAKDPKQRDEARCHINNR